jgi:hypothetical protein
MRLFILAAAGVVAATAALAGSRDDVVEAMGKCLSIADDKARLSCYDALAGQVREALGTPPAALPNNRPPTEGEQKSWFGFNLSSLFGSSPEQQSTPQQFGSDKLADTRTQEETEAKTVDSISAGVTDYALTPFGKFIVFLDNGQVWRQEEGDADHATFHRNPKDNTVTIERGFLGSYNLKLNDSNRIYKVTRVK